MPSPRRLIAPLALATMATQASIVTLAPIVVEIGRDLEASVSAIGQGRALLAGTAVAASFAIGSVIDRAGVRPVLLWGSSLALAGALVTALAPSLPVFFLAHAVVGLGVACLLSAGFAGVAAYFDDRQAWAMSYVVGSQSVAWIVGTPLIGLLADTASWRLAYAVPAAASLLALVACAGMLPRDGRSGATADAPPRPARSPGLIAVLRDPSARRWALAELVAYSAWTAELTYAGAFYVQSYGIEETVVGLLLAIGSVAFLAATGLAARLAGRVRRRPLIIVAALGMGLMLVPVLNVAPAVWFTLALFCVMAVFAGLRTTTSSTLGLSQLPARPGSMMAARTASAQLGYMVGAVVGGAVLALADFGTLGFVLFFGMLGSALLYMRVSDPLDEAPDRRSEARPAVVPVVVD